MLSRLRRWLRLNPTVRHGIWAVVYAALGAALAYAGAHLSELVALPQLAPYLDNPATIAVLAGLIGAALKRVREHEIAERAAPALPDPAPTTGTDPLPAALTATFRADYRGVDLPPATLIGNGRR